MDTTPQNSLAEQLLQNKAREQQLLARVED
jgi:two-component system, OmpR family, sensor histidine kinase VicK